MDIADTCCKEVNAEVSDHLALLRISALASADNAVLFAADSAYLCLDGETEVMSNVNQLGSLLDILVDSEMRTVEHYRSKACLDALVAALKNTMKKYIIGGLAILQLINNEVLSWIVLAVIGWLVLCKLFPELMEGTK